MERKIDLGVPSQVTKIRLSRIKGDSRVYIYPTDWNDLQGIEIQRYKTRTLINMYAFLSSAGMLVDAGYAERFGVEWAGADSPAVPPSCSTVSARSSARPRASPPKRRRAR